MASFFNTLNSYLWGFPMIAVFLFTHIYFTAKTGFVQKKLFKGIKLSFIAEEKDCGNISPFQTLCTTLASTLGTGNIIGIGTAIALGGAGALLWCMIIGLLGIATMYAEAYFSATYRVKNSSGECVGGPMYYMEKGMGAKGLALFYAFSAALGGLVTGACLQSNAITTAVYGFVNVEAPDKTLNVSPLTVGIGVVAMVLTAVVIMGGVKSVGSVCQVMVPFMAVAYMLGCVGIMIVNAEYIPEALRLIVTSAFVPRAVGGGFVGSTVMTACRFGMARGLFSNEAGAGTTGVVSAASKEKAPQKVALVSMTAAFWDTAVVCMMTGVAIVCACLANPEAAEATSGELLANLAFSNLPYLGKPILFFGLITFAFSTIIGWSYIGERCWEYVFGERSTKIYRLLWIGCVGISAVFSSQVLWSMADMVNVLLVLPNITALYMLSPKLNNKKTAHKT